MNNITQISVQIGRGTSIHSGSTAEGYGVIGVECGADVGFRSGGARQTSGEVTCKRCLKKLAAK